MHQNSDQYSGFIWKHLVWLDVCPQSLCQGFWHTNLGCVQTHDIIFGGWTSSMLFLQHSDWSTNKIPNRRPADQCLWEQLDIVTCYPRILTLWKGSTSFSFFRKRLEAKNLNVLHWRKEFLNHQSKWTVCQTTCEYTMHLHAQKVSAYIVGILKGCYG